MARDGVIPVVVVMEQAFSVVAHPQAFVAAGGLLVLAVALSIELSVLARLSLERAGGSQPQVPSSSPESFDWMYE